MSGRAVRTMNGERLGWIVGEFGDFFVVERGGLRKRRHALPKVSPTKTCTASPTLTDDGADADVARLEAYWGFG